ncbi:hypothetical protein FA13DRAFT_566762 [Coprinellus micaceus]|uniref:Uncharacterized protein n=1 Tax=Coprinellus micaceus TaxID=71717 RepID=A0A4Y7T7V4_COPMI|nr:hypothetical protein FA13DRAFT_566762 [Coprinellus micaceus]
MVSKSSRSGSLSVRRTGIRDVLLASGRRMTAAVIRRSSSTTSAHVPSWKILLPTGLGSRHLMRWLLGLLRSRHIADSIRRECLWLAHWMLDLLRVGNDVVDSNNSNSELDSLSIMTQHSSGGVLNGRTMSGPLAVSECLAPYEWHLESRLLVEAFKLIQCQLLALWNIYIGWANKFIQHAR